MFQRFSKQIMRKNKFVLKYLFYIVIYLHNVYLIYETSRNI